MKFELPLLIFDEECPLCVRFSQSLKRIEKTSHIHTVPLQTKELYEEFELNREYTEQSLHLIDEEGKILVGPEVLEYLISLSPLVKKFSWLIESQSGQKTLNIFYQTANFYREALRKRCPKCNKDKSKHPQV